jgi:hypothetical protein
MNAPPAAALAVEGMELKPELGPEIGPELIPELSAVDFLMSSTLRSRSRRRCITVVNTHVLQQANKQVPRKSRSVGAALHIMPKGP